MKPWIKRTLYGLFGASILVGGLSGCGHHRHEYGMGMIAAGHGAQRFGSGAFGEPIPIRRRDELGQLAVMSMPSVACSWRSVTNCAVL